VKEEKEEKISLLSNENFSGTRQNKKTGIKKKCV
jgi:hypothetical protein